MIHAQFFIVLSAIVSLNGRTLQAIKGSNIDSLEVMLWEREKCLLFFQPCTWLQQECIYLKNWSNLKLIKAIEEHRKGDGEN